METNDKKRQEANLLAIYKHYSGAELVSTEKQLQFSGQSGTLDFSDLWILSPAPLPLSYAAFLPKYT